MKINDYKNLDQNIVSKAISAANIASTHRVLLPNAAEIGNDLDFAKAIKEKIDADDEQMQQIKVKFYNSLSETDKKRVIEKDATVDTVVLERRFKYKYTEKSYQDLKEQVEYNKFVLDGCYRAIQIRTIVIEEYLKQIKCSHPMIIEFTAGAVSYSNSISDNEFTLDDDIKKGFFKSVKTEKSLSVCPMCGIKEVKPALYYYNGKRVIINIDRAYMFDENQSIDDVISDVTNDYLEFSDKKLSEKENLELYSTKLKLGTMPKQFVLAK